MKLVLLILLIFYTNPIYCQNWFDYLSFIELLNKSDIIIVGNIQEISLIEDKTSAFIQPLKKAEIKVSQIIKGEEFDFNEFYFRDIFNGCGYAPIIIQNHKNDNILLFGKIKNDSIYQLQVFDSGTEILRDRVCELIEMKNVSNRRGLLHEWIVKSVDNWFTLNLVSPLLWFHKDELFCFLELYPEPFKFSEQQRNRLYTILDKYDKMEYENEGILKVLEKTNDEKYLAILKRYILFMRSKPDHEVEYLMHSCVLSLNDPELKNILKQYKSVYGQYSDVINKRQELIDLFVEKI